MRAETKISLVKTMLAVAVVLFAAALTLGLHDAPEAFAKVNSNANTTSSPGAHIDVQQFPELRGELPYFISSLGKRYCFATPDPNNPDVPTFEPTLTSDGGNGVEVTGSMAETAVPLATSSADVLHDNASCEACRIIQSGKKAGTFFQPYVIEVEGSHAAIMDATIDVGSDLNGKQARIYHCIDGTLEKTSSTVENGTVTTPFEVDKPFTIIITTEEPSQVVEEPPKEDEPPILVLVAVAVICLLGFKLYKSKFSKDSR